MENGQHGKLTLRKMWCYGKFTFWYVCNIGVGISTLWGLRQEQQEPNRYDRLYGWLTTLPPATYFGWVAKFSESKIMGFSTRAKRRWFLPSSGTNCCLIIIMICKHIDNSPL